MSNTQSEIDPMDVEITKLWLVYAAVIYVIAGATIAVIDSLTLNLLQSNVVLLIMSAINAMVSIVCGQFMEYSRQRIKLEENND